MKKIFAFAVVAMLLIAIPASAATYTLGGTFAGGYKYTNGVGTDTLLSLTLKFNFAEAGVMTAYAPLNLAGGVAVNAGWWAKFATEPLNVIISDNSTTGYKWAGLEGTFGLLTSGVSSDRYSKVWGNVSKNLKYAAQASVDDLDTLDDYSIATQLSANLPLGLTLTSDFGWLLDSGFYYMGLATSLTGGLPVVGGEFQLAVGNFADLDLTAFPTLLFWDTDDLSAFAAYAGVTEVEVGPVTLNELSYKFGMNGIEDILLDGDSFYVMDLHEALVKVTGKLGPATVVFQDAVWAPAFGYLGGNNANLDVSATFGALTLGANLDSKLNWQSGFAHGEKLELRATVAAGFGKLNAKLGYNSNWDGVEQYGFGTYHDMVYGSVNLTAPFGLYAEASGSYEQAGTNTAKAGVYAKYENTYTTVPYVVDLKTLVAGRFGYTWKETPSNDFEAIGMLKLDSTVNGLWSAGLLFITREDALSTADFVFTPIVSAYATYKASDMVTVKGTVTYRNTTTTGVYAQLKGDIKVSSNATASVYWGSTGLASVGSTHADYAKPWGPYFAAVSPMYWDTFGASFSINF